MHLRREASARTGSLQSRGSEGTERDEEVGRGVEADEGDRDQGGLEGRGSRFRFLLRRRTEGT